ncbi:MAG: carbamate kinase [Candidatus Cloacimonetes bacterium]|nr:carbamate kinase [Candidatus Cloacimonadota bacterium]
MGKTAVLALGGNAIIKAGQKGTIQEQFKNTQNSMQGIVELIKRGYHLAITHGNGPQVGNLLRQQEAGAKEGIAALNLGVLNAATEGTMGYMIEQSLINKLAAEGIQREVLSLICQIVVDKADPSMQNPTKYVGSTYYSADEAQRLKQELGWNLKEDSGKGYRRVVASPKPREIVIGSSIKTLVDSGKIVIAAGGGGIPVFWNDAGFLESIDAVIDKDFASALLAQRIKADLLVILTGVDKVALNYGKPDMRELDYLSPAEALRYYEAGQFPAGSMGPKILAALDFLQNGGKEVLITSIEKIVDAFEGKTGTILRP